MGWLARAVIIRLRFLFIALTVLACHNDPIYLDDAACPAPPPPALTHSCPALPCVAIESCTIATPTEPPRCKCTLPVGTPPYVAECYGL